MIRHAGAIALRVQRAWRGVILEGPSGVGKSDLTLRALDAGFRLVADDYVRLFVSGGRLFAKAPSTIAAKLEVRGLGVIAQEALAFAPVTLTVHCKTGPGAIERLPDIRIERILGVEVPVLDLWPLEDSAIAKIRRAIEYLGVRS
jgi:serine kinase of HPr protein (carbohydrate metabolism regulator)